VTSTRLNIESTAEAFLHLLKMRGIQYFFANAGTDFAPIVEAYAKLQASGKNDFPIPMVVPHEFVALSMAHGHAMISGRPQAVMVHTTVGTANGLGAVMNAARSNIPVLFMAGRSPIYESGVLGARNRMIQWSQESFDQGSMVREFVKWDYELRGFDQLQAVVDRALTISMADPPGPVYLTLPREVLSERQSQFDITRPSASLVTHGAAPDPDALQQAAKLLSQARNPLVITRSAGRVKTAVHALVEFAELVGAPVVEHHATTLNFPQDHPLHIGFEPSPYVPSADVVVVVETDVPWYVQTGAPSPDAKIIQIGVDPLFSQIPIRSYPIDVALIGEAGRSLSALTKAIAQLGIGAEEVAARRETWAREHSRLRSDWAERGRRAADALPINMAFVSRCLSEFLDDDTIVVNDYDLDPTQCCFSGGHSYFGPPPPAGLGWGLGAAMGAKLAAPEKTVICTVGDGSYMFGSPTAAHFTARAHNIPFLTIVFNNQAWGAVRRATETVLPGGWATRANEEMPLTSLAPSPSFELVAQASGAHAQRVEEPSALRQAIATALGVVQQERRQALLNVICS
jgi:acetolactate synthase I/II/III large subunit